MHKPNEMTVDIQELDEMFTCNECELKTSQKMSLNKHINTNHEESSCSEKVSSFIYRHELEKFALESMSHFSRHVLR